MNRRTASPVLHVEDLRVAFRRSGVTTRAVNGISLTLAEGETLAIVGESGSGKSTTARAILRLIEPEGGSVSIAGQDFLQLRGRALRSARGRAQMVFQDPYSSLDPSMTVAEIIAEPLRVHARMNGPQRRAKSAEMLELCGLSVEYLDRYPAEMSGGQRQRVAIARALATNPDFIIADEAVSALDVSVRNQILNLLQRIQSELKVSILFISHDLGVVRHISDRVAVMYRGRVVETGPTAKIFENPEHPYTRALLQAVPVLRAERGDRVLLKGDPPDPTSVQVGCAFESRCPQARDACRGSEPVLGYTPDGRASACHFPLVHAK